uniref:BOD1/SHG1 domain-containing protein n=1 Tax=Trichuris muris TaxID=70415 RepID=A0A5S6QLP8_TRIMR
MDDIENETVVKVFENKAAQCLQRIKEDGELKLLRERAMADIEERGSCEELLETVSKLSMDFVAHQAGIDAELISKLKVELLEHLEGSDVVNEKVKNIVDRQLNDPSFQSLIIKVIRNVAQSQTDDETLKIIAASHNFPGFGPEVRRQRNAESSVLFKLNLSSMSGAQMVQQVTYPTLGMVDSPLKQQVNVAQPANQSSQYPSYNWFSSTFPPPMQPLTPSMDISQPRLPFAPQLPQYNAPPQNVHPFMFSNVRLPNPFFQSQ